MFTWRDDYHTGQSLYLPGGIIRFQEKLDEWLLKVVNYKLEVGVKKFTGPSAANEIIVPDTRERSHFTSPLFISELTEKQETKGRKLAIEFPYYFYRSDHRAENLISWHEICRKEIKAATDVVPWSYLSQNIAFHFFRF